MHNPITVFLGYIGHKAEKIQELFPEYSPTPNEYGYFLSCENITELNVNEGVIITTNCYSTAEEVEAMLYSRLLFKL
jgi:hypothetical protein